MISPFTDFHRAYRKLLTDILNRGVEETNERTGVRIKALAGGVAFKLDLGSGRLPVAGNRAYWPRIAAAETAWQFLGTQDPDFVMRHAPKMWSKFVEDGRLQTAYGYRWRDHFGRDQLQMAMSELVVNPTNRQLYISAWDPSYDGLGMTGPKNIPCPVGFSLNALDGKLHCSMFLRSSDVFVGLPYDVMSYALTLDAIAAECDLVPGTLHVTMAHAHIYEPHFDDLEECISGEHSSWVRDVEPQLPAWTVDAITKHPDEYVAHMTTLHRRVNRSTWNPKPELVA